MIFDRVQLEKELDECLGEDEVKPVAKTYHVERGRSIIIDNLPKEKWFDIFKDDTIDILNNNNNVIIVNTVRNIKILEKLGYTETAPNDGDVVVTRTWYPSGSLRTERWSINDVTHREDGAAYIALYDNGIKQSEAWYQYGVLHRLYGPAHTIWYENGMTFIEEYHICGVNVIDQRDWLNVRNIPTIPLGWTHNQLRTFIDNFKPTEPDQEGCGDTGMNFGEELDNIDELEDIDLDTNKRIVEEQPPVYHSGVVNIHHTEIPKTTNTFSDKIIFKKG